MPSCCSTYKGARSYANPSKTWVLGLRRRRKSLGATSRLFYILKTFNPYFSARSTLVATPGKPCRERLSASATRTARGKTRLHDGTREAPG